MLISSLLLGTPGKYSILDNRIIFKSKTAQYAFNKNSIGGLVDNLLKNRYFNVLTLGYLHVFVHEMGHALANKVIHNSSSRIIISTDELSGKISPIGIQQSSPIQSSLYALAGPLANIAFSVTLIFTSFTLSPYITQPVTGALAAGAAIWIFGEFFYAVDSLANGDDGDSGDFGIIAQNGPLHLLGATAAVIGTVALGAIATAYVI